MSFEHFEAEGPELLNDEYLPLVNKVRAKSKEFRKSGLKYETYLRDLVVKAHGKELVLLLDCKTRSVMVERISTRSGLKLGQDIFMSLICSKVESRGTTLVIYGQVHTSVYIFPCL